MCGELRLMWLCGETESVRCVLRDLSVRCVCLSRVLSGVVAKAQVRGAGLFSTPLVDTIRNRLHTRPDERV